MRTYLSIFTCFCLTCLTGLAELKVATLHPLMTDLAQQVGGSHVRVVQLIHNHDNPHTFKPTPEVLAKAKGASIYLASGKGLEPYLRKLRDTLGDFTHIVEVGAAVPSQKILQKDAHFICCPHKSHDVVDPHWWHNISYMKMAAKKVATEFSEADPENTLAYRKSASAYIARLTSLENWAKRELSRIPEEKRVLATAHAAFGYFCKAYGFRSLPVKGISSAHQTSASYQAEAIRAIRKNNIHAIFPERRSNPKALEIIAQETNVKVGNILVADGAQNYELMMRANVSTIVQALTTVTK